MVPFWTLPISIACGNTFILKPSEKVPMTMRRVMDLFLEAGLPNGVVNLVNGASESKRWIKYYITKYYYITILLLILLIQAAVLLCQHPKVKVVTFVGTSHVAKLISQTCNALKKKCLALGGAKNHMISASDCHLEMTSQDVVNSFTGCAGQRCMAVKLIFKYLIYRRVCYWPLEINLLWKKRLSKKLKKV